jgi:drug/metabolite transporter superfamily protein YnfA
MQIAESIIYFIIAGLCEIGGGYLVWLWLREGANIWFGIFGAINFSSLLNYSHSSTRKFWTSICSIRRRIYSNGHTMGMAGR